MHKQGNTLVFRAGSVVLLTVGEYSDFGHIGAFVARKQCDLHALATAFKASYQPDDEWDEPDPDTFAAWLVVEGWMFPAECTSVHIGGDGELDIGDNPDDE